MLAYLMAQLSALMSSAESINTKAVLKRFHVHEHVYYKNFVLFFFSLVFGIIFWDITAIGFIYIAYSVIIVFLNENFRSKAMQLLEINMFSILVSSSIFIIYGIELIVGREEFSLKNIIGLFMFIGAFFLFLDVKLKDFYNINKVAIMNVVGIVIIASIDRPIAKTVFDNEWISPETSIFLRIFILIFVFYYFGKKKGMVLKGNQKEGIKSHFIIGFLKYAREMLYTYALVLGSVLIVTLAMNTVLFLTFVLSGFYFKESKWTKRKGAATIIAVVSIVIVTI